MSRVLQSRLAVSVNELKLYFLSVITFSINSPTITIYQLSMATTSNVMLIVSMDIMLVLLSIATWKSVHEWSLLTLTGRARCGFFHRRYNSPPAARSSYKLFTITKLFIRKYISPIRHIQIIITIWKVKSCYFGDFPQTVGCAGA